MNFLEEITTNPGLTEALPKEFAATIQMISISGFFTVLIGLPLGVFLIASAPGGLRPMPVAHRILSDVVVNITRSIPFAILMVSLIPLARLITGTSIGPVAASVSLSIGSIPFFARIVETSLRDVAAGKVDAALVMGSTRMQVITKVLLREALPGLIAGFTSTLVALVGYSAMAGIIGGGGLGRLAYNYGLQRFDTTVMVVIIVIIVAIVQLIQLVGDRAMARVDHRNAATAGAGRRRRRTAAPGVSA